MIPKIDASDGIQRKGMILAAITKLKQICDHPNLVLETPDQENIGQYSGKMDQLIETLSRIQENNQKVIIFTQYIEMGKILQRELSKAFNQEIEFMYGGTPFDRRQEIINNFQDILSPDILSAELTEGNAETDADQNTSDMLPELVQNEENLSQHSILIMSLKTGGLGLNLTAANHVIHIDRWWNPAVENQATDRLTASGKSKPYMFINLLHPERLKSILIRC